MHLEDLIRICAFTLVFAAMASWEIVAPRRALAIGRRPRWASNLGILAVDVLAVRILIPTAAVGAALFAAGRWQARGAGQRSPTTPWRRRRG